jgi:hypothetical protein
VLRGDYSEDQSLEINKLGNIPHEVTSNLEGICSCFLTADQFLLFISDPINPLLTWQSTKIYRYGLQELVLILIDIVAE